MCNVCSGSICFGSGLCLIAVDSSIGAAKVIPYYFSSVSSNIGNNINSSINLIKGKMLK